MDLANLFCKVTYFIQKGIGHIKAEKNRCEIMYILLCTGLSGSFEVDA
jgi:hypothetical protein